MNPQAADKASLLRVAEWGQVWVADGERGPATVWVEEIFALQGDLDGACALGRLWQSHAFAALPAPLRVARVDRGPSLGGALRVERDVPRGSTLTELLHAHGPLTEDMVATLALDLVAGVHGWHKRGLTVGLIDGASLVVCPPGRDDHPGLLAFDAGLPLMVSLAGGPLGGWQSPRFRSLFETVEVLAPELLEGAEPSLETDAYALAAVVGWLLLGRHLVQIEDPTLAPHAARQGPSPATSLELRRRAPTLAPAILEGLAVDPRLRLGAVSALLGAIAELLGPRRVANYSVAAGGGPWAMGSPLIPLAAYANSTAWTERFRRDLPTRVAAAAGPPAAQTLGGPQMARATPPGPTPGRTAPGATSSAQQARLRAALSELEVRRAMADRTPAGARLSVVKLVVVLLTMAVVAAILFVGMKRTRTLATEGLPSQIAPRPVAPPVLPQPGPLVAPPHER